jgi:hypothetical protein
MTKVPLARDWLELDEHLTGLQQEINAKLEPDCQVKLWVWRKKNDANGPVMYSALFESSGQTHETPAQEEPFFDSERVIKEFKAWRADLEVARYKNRYTTVPPEEWE